MAKVSRGPWKVFGSTKYFNDLDTLRQMKDRVEFTNYVQSIQDAVLGVVEEELDMVRNLSLSTMGLAAFVLVCGLVCYVGPMTVSRKLMHRLLLAYSVSRWVLRLVFAFLGQWAIAWLYMNDYIGPDVLGLLHLVTVPTILYCYFTGWGYHFVNKSVVKNGRFVYKKKQWLYGVDDVEVPVEQTAIFTDGMPTSGVTTGTLKWTFIVTGRGAECIASGIKAGTTPPKGDFFIGYKTTEQGEKFIKTLTGAFVIKDGHGHTAVFSTMHSYTTFRECGDTSLYVSKDLTIWTPYYRTFKKGAKQWTVHSLGNFSRPEWDCTARDVMCCIDSGFDGATIGVKVREPISEFTIPKFATVFHIHENRVHGCSKGAVYQDRDKANETGLFYADYDSSPGTSGGVVEFEGKTLGVHLGSSSEIKGYPNCFAGVHVMSTLMARARGCFDDPVHEMLKQPVVGRLAEFVQSYVYTALGELAEAATGNVFAKAMQKLLSSATFRKKGAGYIGALLYDIEQKNLDPYYKDRDDFARDGPVYGFQHDREEAEAAMIEAWAEDRLAQGDDWAGFEDTGDGNSAQSSWKNKSKGDKRKEFQNFLQESSEKWERYPTCVSLATQYATAIFSVAVSNNDLGLTPIEGLNIYSPLPVAPAVEAPPKILEVKGGVIKQVHVESKTTEAVKVKVKKEMLPSVEEEEIQDVKSGIALDEMDDFPPVKQVSKQKPKEVTEDVPPTGKQPCLKEKVECASVEKVPEVPARVIPPLPKELSARKDLPPLPVLSKYEAAMIEVERRKAERAKVAEGCQLTKKAQVRILNKSFIQLDQGPWKRALCRQYDDEMSKHANKVEFCIGSDAHPSREVIYEHLCEVIPSIANGRKLSFGITGDSTWKKNLGDVVEMSEMIKAETGCDVYFQCVSGASFEGDSTVDWKSFQWQADQLVGYHYDHHLHCGGWNDRKFHPDKVSEFYETIAKCLSPPGLEKSSSSNDVPRCEEQTPKATVQAHSVSIGPVIPKMSGLSGLCLSLETAMGCMGKVCDWLDEIIAAPKYTVPLKKMFPKRNPESTKASCLPKFHSKVPEENKERYVGNQIETDVSVALMDNLMQQLMSEDDTYANLTISEFFGKLSEIKKIAQIDHDFESELRDILFPKAVVENKNQQTIPGTVGLGMNPGLNAVNNKTAVVTGDVLQRFKDFDMMLFDDDGNPVLDEKGNPAMKYVPAQRTAAGMRKSLTHQLGSKLERTADYDAEHVEKFAEGQVEVPFKDMPLLAYFTELVSHVDGTKPTAYSKTYDGCEIKQKYWGGPFARNNIMRVLYTICVITLMTSEFSEQSTAQQKFEMGAIEPEVAFIKDEMHSFKKAEVNRWRMIWNAGAHNEMVVRFFHDFQNKGDIAVFAAGLTHSEGVENFGSCPGMGHHDDGHAHMTAAMKRMGKDKPESEPPVVSQADASGWDFGVTQALWKVDGWIRAKLAENAGWPPAMCQAILNFAGCCADHLLCVGRDVYMIIRKGIMGSGCASTSASNSRMRGCVHSQSRWADVLRVSLSLTMGDDIACADSLTDEQKDRTEALGCRLSDYKEVQLVNGEYIVDFTSHNYNVKAGTAIFNNVEKLLARILMSEKPLELEQVCGVMFAIRNNDDATKERVRNAIIVTGAGDHLTNKHVTGNGMGLSVKNIL